VPNTTELDQRAILQTPEAQGLAQLGYKNFNSDVNTKQ